MLLILLGFLVGVIGTLVGAGGGFILSPILLIAYPKETPEMLTGISLAVIFVNALSGSVAYARMRRILYRYGILFAAAAMPGAILGVHAVALVSRRTFDLLLALLLIVGSMYLFATASSRQTGQSDGCVVLSRPKLIAGIFLSALIGFVSGFLGIGGGIIHVPLLCLLFGFPVHYATATSHFILAITAGTAMVTHIAAGTYAAVVNRTALLCLGVVAGAQVGARLSRIVKGILIMRILAIALLGVGIRLMLLR
jgi:hypothetical protein